MLGYGAIIARPNQKAQKTRVIYVSRPMKASELANACGEYKLLRNLGVLQKEGH